MKHPAALAVAIGLLARLASPAPAQQPNSPSATLLVNGTPGAHSVQQGGSVNVAVLGGANQPVVLAGGDPAAAGIPTVYGLLDVWPITAIPVNGLAVPSHWTDGSGGFAAAWQIPWLAPLAATAAIQAAVGDSGSLAGFTLSGMSTVTSAATSIVPAHLFFDPTLGALGSGYHLPPAGTLPGDLPTLSPGGTPGPTAIFSNGLPVHSSFQPPHKCHECHSTNDIWQYMGSSMAQASRNPVFLGQYAITLADVAYANSVGLTHATPAVASDFCTRCHSPTGWYGGRSGYLGDGSPSSPYRQGMFGPSHAADEEGIVCDLCHRAVSSLPSIAPSSHVIPGQPDNTQLVFTTTTTKFGRHPGTLSTSHPNGTTAYGALIPPAAETPTTPVPANAMLGTGTAVSPFHGTGQGGLVASSELCGNCHNATNPLSGHGAERTYAEWAQSNFGNTASPDYKPCKDCHMGDTAMGVLAMTPGSDPTYGTYSKVRRNIRSHHFAGGNVYTPTVLKVLSPNLDQAWTAPSTNYAGLSYSGSASRNTLFDQTITKAQTQLRAAAILDLSATETSPGVIGASVTITNLTGHKLPTGAESRVMWIKVTAEDANGAPFYVSGDWDTHYRIVRDPDAKVYEMIFGMNYPEASIFNQPTLHLALNNMIWKDNRILAKGMIQSTGTGSIGSFDPVTHPWPAGGVYPDGQNWDTTNYTIPIPAGTARPIKVKTTVFYQTVTHEYVEFLSNGGDSIVQTTPDPMAAQLLNLWNSGFVAQPTPVGQVGAGSTADPTSPFVNQTALAVIP